jgi:hypothetical protein
MSRLATLLLAVAGVFLLAGTAPAIAQTAAPRGRLIVTVNDPTGGFLPTATVTITGVEASTRATTFKPLVTTNQGIAIFDNLAPGRYTASAEFSGFEKSSPKEVRVRAGDNRLTIVLALARFQDSVTVGRDRQEAGSDRASTFGTLLTAAQIDELSDDPEIMRQQLQELAGPGVTFAVDSFEGGQLPNKSQIRSIRISRDQFAAESHFAGGIRIEIVTQPGSGELRGNANTALYTSALDGKHPLVHEAPPSQDRSGTLTLNGTLIKDRMSFTTGIRGNNNFSTPVQAASTTTGAGAQLAGLKSRLKTMGYMAGIDWAVTKNQTARVGVQRTTTNNTGLGVGTYDSLDRGYGTKNSSTYIQAGHTGPIGRRSMLYNRFTLTRSVQRTSSDFEGVTFFVLDDLTRGGAQRRGETITTGFNLNTDLDHVRGRHSFRSGLEINGTRYRSDAESNYFGTYTFESPEAFAAGRPRSFTKRIGDPNIRYTNTQVSLYVQDDIRLSKTLTMTPGVRYEVQSHVKDYNNVMPRFGVTWAPGAGKATYRASLGLFYDWLNTGTYQQTLQFDGFRMQEVNIANPGYPDPGAFGAAPPVQRYLLADDLVLPRTARASLGYSRQVSTKLSVNASYYFTRAADQLVGENLNAPLNGVRPDPLFANVIRAVPNGRARAHSADASANLNLAGLGSNPTAGPLFQWRRALTVGASYGYGNSYNNTDGPFSVPATDLASEWGPSSGDTRHRGSINLGTAAIRGVRASLYMSRQSARPITIRTGTDDNGDLIFNDRPAGVRRNSARVPGQWSSSANFGYQIPFGSRQVSTGGGVQLTQVNGVIAATTNSAPQPRYRLQISLNVSNLFNRPQWSGYNGIITSKNFLQPNSAYGTRNIRLNMSLSF